MMNLNKILNSGLLEQYVLGLTSEEEQVRVEALMVEHPEVHQKVQRLQSCMEHYTGLHNIPEPKRRQKIADCAEAKANAQSNAPKQRSLAVECKFGKPKDPIAEVRDYTRLLTGVACFFIVGFAGLSIYLYLVNADHEANLQRLHSKFHILEKQHFETLTYLNILEEKQQLLKDNHTRQFMMNGAQPGFKAVFYQNDQQRKSYLDPISLPEPPANHHYEMWAEDDGQRKSLGSIKCTANQHGLIPVEYVNARKYMLTMQPENGGEGKPVLVGVE